MGRIPRWPRLAVARGMNKGNGYFCSLCSLLRVFWQRRLVTVRVTVTVTVLSSSGRRPDSEVIRVTEGADGRSEFVTA
jgi:hypothetical protein